MKKMILIFLIFITLISSTQTFSQPMNNAQFTIEKIKNDIKQNKYDKGAYMGLIYLYSEENEYENMLNTMQQVARMFKKDLKVLQAFNEYSKEYYSKKNYEIAQKIAKLTMSHFKDDPDVALILSEIYLKQNKLNDSIAVLENFLKKVPDDLLITDKLFESYIYKADYDKAFQTARKAQQYRINNIYLYFLEGLSLQLNDKEKAIDYYKAYHGKLSIAQEYEPRIKVAEKIAKTLTNNAATADDYKTLIEFTEKLNAPKSYYLIQARYAQKLFPENTYFTQKINSIYEKVGISKPQE